VRRSSCDGEAGPAAGRKKNAAAASLRCMSMRCRLPAYHGSHALHFAGPPAACRGYLRAQIHLWHDAAYDPFLKRHEPP